MKQAVADIGYGAVQVSELQKRFSSRVMGCYYVQRPELTTLFCNRDWYPCSYAYPTVPGVTAKPLAARLDVAERGFSVLTKKPKQELMSPAT